MNTARTDLLERVIAEVAANGLADRSLRQVAEAIGSSHRMLHYHFQSREGLVAAIVEQTEAAQRQLLATLAEEATDAAGLVRALWHQVASPEMRPFVRLFFECVAVTGGEGLTDPWIDLSLDVGRKLGLATNADDLRLGVAVTRGLLIDVLATDDSGAATRSLERYLELWTQSADD